MTALRRLPQLLAGRRSAWAVLVAALLATGLAFALPANPAAGDTPNGLPASADSARAAALATSLPGSDSTPALVVYSRDGVALTVADEVAVQARANALAPLATDSPDTLMPVFSDDGTTAIVTVPLVSTDDATALSDAVAAIRAAAAADLPDGLVVQVTGPAGFAVDIGKVFEGADLRLLLVTVLVVAVLLIVTYRSPWLWLVPLTVVFVADRVAAIVAGALAPTFGIVLDGATTGILSVLVFGAGTNYALLLIARYREQLRLVDDRHEAMVAAWRGSAPAILASGSTVALSLLTLLFADLTTTSALGFACAVGIVVALAYALLVLPAAMVVFGRGLFWPFVPRPGTADDSRGPRGWERLGTAVARRPAPVALGSVVVLGLMALGATGITTGLSATEQFRDKPESVVGQEAIARAFPAGASDPASIIVASPAAQAAAAAAREVPGVAEVTVDVSGGGVTRLFAVLDAAPGTEESFAEITALRVALAGVPGADAAVGGSVAEELDLRDAAARDRLIIVPSILAVVLLVLILLLRALVAPVLLLLTVVLSFTAALGASWLVFQSVFGFAALDVGVPLLAFLFLVALGVDYNIFLVTRAKEESVRWGTRPGMIRALGATGGVITSAGILLAAVFAVLGVLPIITLTQIGVIVGIGVLIDTLLVRTVLVPALAFMLGDRFWWPSGLAAAVADRSRPGHDLDGARPDKGASDDMLGAGVRE